MSFTLLLGTIFPNRGEDQEIENSQETELDERI